MFYAIVYTLITLKSAFSASESCQLFPLESYTPTYQISSEYIFSSEENLTEIAEILSQKQGGHYQQMFLDMQALVKRESHASAFYNLGQFYRLGIGTEIDVGFAIENYFDAALRGSDKAMINLSILLDEAIQNKVDLPQTLYIPANKAYSLYWLLVAISVVKDKSVKAGLEKILNTRLIDEEYQAEFANSYPNYNLDNKNPVYQLSQATLLFKSQFDSIFIKKVKATNLIGHLNTLDCLLKTAMHFIKLNKADYMISSKAVIDEIVEKSIVELKKLKRSVKDKQEYNKFLNSLENWKKEDVTSFLETTNTL